MKTEFFGKLKSGEEVHKYTVNNGILSLSVMDRGATVLSLEYLGRDVVLGFDSPRDYEIDFLNHGATIGRVADRIEGASFSIDGKEYHLTKNNGEHCLHGGNRFNKVVWKLYSFEENKITFFYSSPDGEDGFPSRLDVYVSYIIDGANFIIDYRAIPFGKTPISLTNHTYFNLDGIGSLILNHKAKLYADTYLEINDKFITTGKQLSVTDTIFDFREEKLIGRDFYEGFHGYDNYYVISADTSKKFNEKELFPAAEFSGRDLKMKVYTDQEGFLFYTGNYLKGPDFKGAVPERDYMGFCIETGGEPNSVKRGKCIFSPDEIYSHTTVFTFERVGNFE